MADFTPESSQDPNAPPRSRSGKELQLEIKRTRGEISCAECRRQKLKCDKKIPCSSCVRRGCQNVCPTGTFPSKTTSRHSANSENKLRKKILLMSKRIRQLEDALKILQARVSSSPHPLLVTDPLETKAESASDDHQEQNDVTETEICVDFGTLTIAEKGITHFVGRSGSDAMITIAFNEKTEEVKRKANSKLAPEVVYLINSFPFSPISSPKDQILATIASHLPPYDRATALVESYLQHISLFFRPVRREQIMEELIPKFYKRGRDAEHEPDAVNTRDSSEIVEHQLALLLAVFACGAAGDLTLEACNEEGETYQQLARGALSLHSVFEGTSLATVQAVALIGTFVIHSASAQTIESAFKLLSLALCLGITIGLHWDPSSWNIELKFVQRRRSLFWELYKMETHKSLASGRPLMLRLDEIDCKLPDDDDATVNEDGTTSQGFWRWKTDFATKIANIVAQRMCAARPMKYADILELDRIVRGNLGTIGSPPELSNPYSAESLQYLLKAIDHEAILFFIHRNFFILAIRENTKDPLRSRFASSFLATYSSAISILRAIRRDFDCSNHLLLRQWTLWVLALGCGVAVGSIAATNSLSDLSQTAVEELDAVIDLFEKATTHPVAKNGIPILLRLREKAKINLASAGLHDGVLGPSSSTQVKTEEVDEELSMIGGTSRLVREERRSINPAVTLASTALPSCASPTVSGASSHQAWRVDEALNALAETEGQHYIDFNRGLQTSSAVYSNSGYSLPAVPNDASVFSSNNPDQPNFIEPPMFGMNTNLDNFEFSIGGSQHNSFLNSQSNSLTGDVDVMIEDIWRTILEDPRLTNTGVNEPSFQF